MATKAAACGPDRSRVKRQVVVVGLVVEGQNHQGHNCLFTTNFTLLAAFSRIGVKASFSLKK
jgi:hypothetical protein